MKLSIVAYATVTANLVFLLIISSCSIVGVSQQFRQNSPSNAAAQAMPVVKREVDRYTSDEEIDPAGGK